MIDYEGDVRRADLIIFIVDDGVETAFSSRFTGIL
jgi:hypothetical protein